MQAKIGAWAARWIARPVLALTPLTGYLPLASSGKLGASRFLWPPIGSAVVYAAGIAAALVVAIGKLPLVFRPKSKAWFVGGLVTTLIALGFYASLLLTYVKGVDTPYNGTQYRAVGKIRTPTAERCPEHTSDEDLLKCGGLEDASIETLWTASSVRQVRLELFISYVLLLGSLNVLIESSPQRRSSTKK